ncbi:hypothetical protein [Bradyrhizobium sp. CCBAU 53415]|uniref:hypothetical protein n=1 Tax=Bradyrhizobium sp. CCBAU 53415 TaxID=1325119 RepID=UPI002305BFF4|nr:hypothetical protein [Bradyrhizobium sp. CCBAU 53415]
MEPKLSEREKMLLSACKLAQSELAPESRAHQALSEAIAKAEYDPTTDPMHAFMQYL